MLLLFVVAACFIETGVSETSVELDFNCHTELNKEWMKTLRHDCKLRSKDPTARPCTEACIVRDLGFLSEAMNETSIHGVSRYGTVGVTAVLEDLFSDNQDLAEAVQKNVEDLCTKAINTHILEKKTPCEDWDDILTCVNTAVCNATIHYIDMYPDLRCHDGYKRGPARDDHYECQERIKHPFHKNCYKACMLQQFRILDYQTETDKDPEPRLGGIGDEHNGFFGGLVGELQWRFKEGFTDQGTKIAKKIHEKCSTIFNTTVLVEKKSCEEWAPLYDCIANAVECT